MKLDQGDYPGKCEMCGTELSRRGMVAHVLACAAEHDKGGPGEPLVHLHITTPGGPEYWLYVEARPSASLKQLDALLRRLWLECCSHMSEFRLGRAELSKASRIEDLKQKGRAFDYEYDFGSTTSLTGQVLGSREGSPGRHAVRLLARNVPLPWVCAECSKPAVLVCSLCAESAPSTFCRVHAPDHPCAADEPFLPIVNSPRMGVCGYTG